MKTSIPFFMVLCRAFASAAPPLSHLVDVGDGVKIELLDWGGRGQPLILLAGFGNTAHVYEDFAPKLAETCHVHVYGITRRGFGNSSKPERGYSVPELAEDNWRVVQSLKIEKPVLAGHSLAGSELAFLGQKHSSQLAGLIFLDANADPMDYPLSNPEFLALTLKSMKGSTGPPQRTAADNASIKAYQTYQKKSGMVPLPAAEIGNMYEITPDGSVGKNRMPLHEATAISDGSIQKIIEDKHARTRSLRGRRSACGTMEGTGTERSAGTPGLGTALRATHGVHSSMEEQSEERQSESSHCGTAWRTSLHVFE